MLRNASFAVILPLGSVVSRSSPRLHLRAAAPTATTVIARDNIRIFSKICDRRGSDVQSLPIGEGERNFFRLARLTYREWGRCTSGWHENIKKTSRYTKACDIPAFDFIIIIKPIFYYLILKRLIHHK